jgi:hypothetical protein
VQAVELMQEMLSRRLPPLTAGVVTTDQSAPFHDSTIACGSPFPSVELPTARQLCEETHDTPSSSLLPLPAGMGTESNDHVRPFHDSISTFAAGYHHPTIVQLVELIHDTPVR